MKNRIDLEQEVLEVYQAARENKREDIFALALEYLPTEALIAIQKKYGQSEVRS